MTLRFQNLRRLPVVNFRCARFGQRFAIQIGEQCRRRFIIADIVGAIDIAIADPVLQRDAPLPASIARG